ncbi:LOW QUALITY PROTEIN: hypothetical protein PHMEG_00020532 [Phytophthora megakarya]|uniref:Uncharacterized protein n=1 Tax=Phytophthora megakarya TaxID=4795 RepID=A0A225VRG5_9STRA|nr:LOW QUALITY PROTEIN: hypothetical protein PHMEG_00020532 [Phytophthora megakarya]
MSQEPTDTPQPRGSRGPASRGSATGRARLGGCPCLEAPTSRHLVLPGTDTEIPALPSSTTIPNSGDAEDIPAPLSLTTIPGSNRADDFETRLGEDLLAPNAVGSSELAIVSSLQPAAPPAPPPRECGHKIVGDARHPVSGIKHCPRNHPIHITLTGITGRCGLSSEKRSPGRPWTANVRCERLCLPMVTDPVALQVDLEELRFSGGARDITSVIAALQTMLHDVGYAFIHVGTHSEPGTACSSGRSVHRAVGDTPFQTLDLEVASAFQVEEDGNTLMLTLEEQELLGVTMVTRLRLAHVRPQDWSETDTKLKQRRGITDPSLSVPSWSGSDEATRVWGGPIPEVVGTSSLASGDALMVTPDENMPSPGGGSQGSPGLEPSAAMIGGYMATTGSETGQPYTVEQPTLYVSVAEYPPGQDARLPPHAPTPMPPSIRGDGSDNSEEETKSDVPVTGRGTHLPKNIRDRDQDLREADRQILELRAALAARAEQERVRNEKHRAARTAQANQAKLSQEVWEYREAELQERAARKTERRKAADQVFASLQAKCTYLRRKGHRSGRNVPRSGSRMPAE